jgi:hypothetical protein
MVKNQPERLENEEAVPATTLLSINITSSRNKSLPLSGMLTFNP